MSYARRYFKDAFDGSPLYFHEWTGIGPKFTKHPEEAARFDTEEAAGRVTFALAPMDTVPHPLAAQEQP